MSPTGRLIKKIQRHPPAAMRIRMVWATERQAIGDFRDLLYATSTGVTGDVGAPELGGVRRGDIPAAS